MNRGGLGPLTVWVTKDDYDDRANTPSTNTNATASASTRNARSATRSTTYTQYNLRSNNNNNNNNSSTPSTNITRRGQLRVSQKYWNKIYEKKHKASFRNYQPLDLSNDPIILKPGQVRGIYIHSSISDDSGIIYDNQNKVKTHDDDFITILPARAHVSNRPFGTRPIWGYGNAWRGKIL